MGDPTPDRMLRKVIPVPVVTGVRTKARFKDGWSVGVTRIPDVALPELMDIQTARLREEGWAVGATDDALHLDRRRDFGKIEYFPIPSGVVSRWKIFVASQWKNTQ